MGKNRWVLFFVVSLAAMLLSGCEKVYYTQIISEGAYLETPTGKYPFRNITMEEAKNINLFNTSRITNSYLIAESVNVKVLYCVICATNNLLIAGNQKNLNVTVLTENATYHVENKSIDPLPHHDKNFSIEFIRPFLKGSSDFLYLQITTAGPRGSIEDKSPMHRLAIPFLVGKSHYIAHLNLITTQEFEYKYKFSVTGTP